LSSFAERSLLQDFSNDDVANTNIFCRKCQPSDSLIFNLATGTVIRILSHLDFATRRTFMSLSKSFRSLAREAESSLRFAHSSVDVALHLLHQYPCLSALTLFSWHPKFARLVSKVRHLTIVSAAPSPSLGGLPRHLKSLRIHDSAVSDAGVCNALGRGGRGLVELQELNLSGTSVTGAFPHLLPGSLQSLILSATPTNDAGLFASGICSLEGFGEQFPELIHLDLSHTLVSNSVLKNLPRKKLRELNLSYCPEITAEGLISWLSGATRLLLERLILLGIVSDADAAKIQQLAPKTTLVIASAPTTGPPPQIKV
jgi:hypothetical protein